MAVCNKTTSLEQEIGQRIIILRGGETQEELAAAIGVSREIIQHWERGTRHIKADHLFALAKHFGKSVDYLVGLVGGGDFVDNKKLVAQRINTALAMRGKKQKELAHAIGVTDNTISYFCSGNRTPNLQQLVAIAKELDVSTDYLLGLAGPGNSTADEQLRMISEYTGLSNDAVSRLHDLSQYDKRDTRAYSDLLSLILSDEGLEYLLGLLEGYFAEDNEITASSTSINPQDLAIFAASNEIRLMLDRIAPEFIKRYIG